jgi:hypothetical protein
MMVFTVFGQTQAFAASFHWRLDDAQVHDVELAFPVKYRVALIQFKHEKVFPEIIMADLVPQSQYPAVFQVRLETQWQVLLVALTTFVRV